jgi:hypothetical protein
LLCASLTAPLAAPQNKPDGIKRSREKHGRCCTRGTPLWNRHAGEASWSCALGERQCVRARGLWSPAEQTSEKNTDLVSSQSRRSCPSGWGRDGPRELALCHSNTDSQSSAGRRSGTYPLQCTTPNSRRPRMPGFLQDAHTTPLSRSLPQGLLDFASLLTLCLSLESSYSNPGHTRTPHIRGMVPPGCKEGQCPHQSVMD